MQRVTSTSVVRYYGDLMAAVSKGEAFVITSHGRPVALLGPAPEDVDVRELTEYTRVRPTTDGD